MDRNNARTETEEHEAPRSHEAIAQLCAREAPQMTYRRLLIIFTATGPDHGDLLDP
jgi:hypothetical protein